MNPPSTISSKKRSNNKQRTLMLERLHANINLARGNQAEASVMQLWSQLSTELNSYGCSRTIQEWQHIWSLWVAKIKAKARKIMESIQRTGGGPATDATLTDEDNKVLEIIGSASVYGHDSIEFGIPDHDYVLGSQPSSPAPSSSQSEQQPQSVPHSQLPGQYTQEPPRTPQLPSRQPRQRTRIRQPAYFRLIEAVNRNSEIQREAMIEAAKIIAAALKPFP